MHTTTPATSAAGYTFAQAAALLGVGVLDIRRNVRAERIPTVRVGRATRIPADWLEWAVAAEQAAGGAR
jgi:excisionase family DNA binding protein